MPLRAGGLTAAEVDSYRRCGVLFPLDIYSSDSRQHKSIEEGFATVERERIDPRNFTKDVHLSLIDLHLKKDWLWNLASDERVLDVVESLIGGDILLLSTHIFCKYGPSEHNVAWHQDCRYWGLDTTDDVVTLWYALDNSDENCGAMEVIPGTHLGALREHGRAEQGGNLLASNQALAVSSEEESRKQTVVLRKGAASLHHGRLWHCSPPNTSTNRRCGITLRFCPPRVKQVQASNVGSAWRAVLMRGVDAYNNFGDTSTRQRVAARL
eukprot:TRINITY_DN26618_c0_g1_i1.p1 TRINITY_DN26618_c0_g1~~TRINITY_DN26618_c0_g1_i1.p1  ORF type:complete len:268 (+),score=43.84 TRINITY_DN26618_c0_g1_i1:68-871(+)